MKKEERKKKVGYKVASNERRLKKIKMFLSKLFTGLPDKRLYPSVSAVYGNTEVSMVYLGPPLDG